MPLDAPVITTFLFIIKSSKILHIRQKQGTIAQNLDRSINVLQAFLNKLAQQQIDFEDTIQLINQLYNYHPSRFSNGLSQPVINQAGQNEGSCRIFAFAQLNHLSEAQTLACFGRFYQEVLNDPQGTSHGNIRAFMRDGWAGIQFEGKALTLKKQLILTNR